MFKKSNNGNKEQTSTITEIGLVYDPSGKFGVGGLKLSVTF